MIYQLLVFTGEVYHFSLFFWGATNQVYFKFYFQYAHTGHFVRYT